MSQILGIIDMRTVCSAVNLKLILKLYPDLVIQ